MVMGKAHDYACELWAHIVADRIRPLNRETFNDTASKTDEVKTATTDEEFLRLEIQDDSQDDESAELCVAVHITPSDIAAIAQAFKRDSELWADVREKTSAWARYDADTRKFVEYGEPTDVTEYFEKEHETRRIEIRRLLEKYFRVEWLNRVATGIENHLDDGTDEERSAMIDFKTTVLGRYADMREDFAKFAPDYWARINRVLVGPDELATLPVRSPVIIWAVLWTLVNDRRLWRLFKKLVATAPK
jgi:hypothetical protein